MNWFYGEWKGVFINNWFFNESISIYEVKLVLFCLKLLSSFKINLKKEFECFNNG